MGGCTHCSSTGLFVFIACWAGYAWFSEHSRWASGGLISSGHVNSGSNGLTACSQREVRVTDSTLIGNLVNSVTFYANTTIYIIAGLVAALGAADKLLNFTSGPGLRPVRATANCWRSS
jgi:uncharacterized membrane protein